MFGLGGFSAVSLGLMRGSTESAVLAGGVGFALLFVVVVPFWRFAPLSQLNLANKGKPCENLFLKGWL